MVRTTVIHKIGSQLFTETQRRNMNIITVNLYIAGALLLEYTDSDSIWFYRSAPIHCTFIKVCFLESTEIQITNVYCEMSLLALFHCARRDNAVV